MPGPDGRRHDRETRDRLKEIQDGYVKWARRVILLFGLQVLILFVQGVFGYIQLQDIQDKAAKNRQAAVERQDRLREASALGQCRRVNNVRRQLNVTEAAVYLTLNQASESPALQLTPKGRAIARRYRTFARAVTFTADTNCQAAVRSPLEYVPPTPVPFYKLPERFALELTKHPQNPPRILP